MLLQLRYVPYPCTRGFSLYRISIPLSDIVMVHSSEPAVICNWQYWISKDFSFFAWRFSILLQVTCFVSGQGQQKKSHYAHIFHTSYKTRFPLVFTQQGRMNRVCHNFFCQFFFFSIMLVLQFSPSFRHPNFHWQIRAGPFFGFVDMYHCFKFGTSRALLEAHAEPGVDRG